MDRMIVYNIVDNEFRAGDDNEPNVTIVGRMAIAVTRTIYIRCEIPVGGMGFMELMGMSTRLGIRAAVLAEEGLEPQVHGVEVPAALARVGVDGAARRAAAADLLRAGRRRHLGPRLDQRELLDAPLAARLGCGNRRRQPHS